MHNCGNHDASPVAHTNAFVDLNGIPYLLAEYLDRRTFQQIDRSLIKSEIFIDQSESMRAVVDISIDDIGKRSSDGYPAIVGNNTKQKNLLTMISNNVDRLDHQFDVFRRGIIIRVNYQLENQNTHQVIRSMSEDLRISDRNYFLEINPRDINDNAIIVNFCNSMVSTINEFTHGRERMVLRITHVQMFYECVKQQQPMMPHIKESMCGYPGQNPYPGPYGKERDFYRYHEQMQSRHVLGSPYCTSGNDYMDGSESITPPGWIMFNRFYHFDNEGKDIILHDQEIYDPMCKATLIPCGSARVNREFVINPGHRIIFKFSIWKNDVTVLNDAADVAHAVGAPIMDYMTHCDCNHHYPPNCHPDGDPCHNLDYDAIMRMMHENRITDDRQNYAIHQLMDSIRELQYMIQNQKPPVEKPDDPVTPDDPNTGCNCDCDSEHSEINATLDELKSSLDELRNQGAIPDGVDAKLQELQDQINQIKNSSTGGSDINVDEINQKIAEIQNDLASIKGCECDHDGLNQQLTDLQDQIDEVKEQVESGADTPNIKPIPVSKIEEILNRISDSSN